MAKADKKTESVNIRFTPEDFDILKRQADERGISIATHARNIILKNLCEIPLSGEITDPEDVLKICKVVLSEYLESDEYKNRQKEIVKETLKEMAK